MIIVSACLAGKPCRYDGEARPNEETVRLVREGKAVCACPEAMAGLTIPRPPAEICGGDGFDVLSGKAGVYNKEGTCITQDFIEGAQKFLQYARKIGAEEVWLKAKSPSCAATLATTCVPPSCGTSRIYDGSFQGVLREGCGVTCALLKKNDIKVVEIP